MSDIFKIIKTADRLTGYNLTEKDGSGKAKKVTQIYDRPLAGMNTNPLSGGANVDVISEQVQPGRTLVFTGIMGKGLDGVLITIYGEDDTPIIKDLIGDVVGVNKEAFPFTCPHVVKPGNTYRINLTNSTTSSIPAGTCKVVILGIKLTWA